MKEITELHFLFFSLTTLHIQASARAHVHAQCHGLGFVIFNDWYWSSLYC